MKTRTFIIKDLDYEMLVEETSRKEILDYMEEYIENLSYEWFDGSDTGFNILYKDGSSDSVNVEYDGHKIKKINIQSIVYDNPCSSMTFGKYSINEYGVVSPDFEMKIDENIEEK